MKNDLTGSIPSYLELTKNPCYFHNSSLSGDISFYNGDLSQLEVFKEIFNNDQIPEKNISGELPASLGKPSFL